MQEAGMGAVSGRQGEGSWAGRMVGGSMQGAGRWASKIIGGDRLRVYRE